MAAVVENIPYEEFNTDSLVTRSGSIVSRRRVLVRPRDSGDYGPPGVSTLTSKIVFDIQDPESFLNTSTLRFGCYFTPSFQFTSYPGNQTLGNEVAGDLQYAPYNLNPSFDVDSHALIASVRIGNAQGLVIEDKAAYNLFHNIVKVCKSGNNANAHSVMDHQVFSQQRDFDQLVSSPDASSDTFQVIAPQASFTTKNYLEIEIDSSFLKSTKYVPLFLFRSALRIELEFADPRIAFVSNRMVRVVELDLDEISITDAGVVRMPNSLWTALLNKAKIGAAFATRKNLGHVTFRLHIDSNANETFDTFVAAATADGGDHHLVTFKPIVDQYRQVPTAIWLQATKQLLRIEMYRTLVNQRSPKHEWSYKIEDPRLICDMVKPSAEVQLQYMNMYNIPSGIPYKFTRVFYQTKQIDVIGQTFQQIPLNLNVRSLKGILVVITDTLTSLRSVGTPDNTIYNYPAISTFQKKGLAEAQLSIGAQQFPNYRLLMDTTYVNQHLLELENLVGKLNPGLLLDFQSLYTQGTNIFKYGPFGSDISFQALGTANDCTKFVLGISTMKIDGDFASGIDTTASGAVTLSLNFGAAYTTPRMIHIFGLADSVFTLQKDASLVRY